MLQNPYIAGVERFEAPFFTSKQEGRLSPLEQAAHFCILLWQHFQPDLRTIRYTLNRDLLADITVEITQQPEYDDLINFEIRDAQQIDLECVSLQPAKTSRDFHTRFGQKEEHFPAFLEVFIPLHHHHPQTEAISSESLPADRLVIWCRPHLLPTVTALWEQAAALLANRA